MTENASWILKYNPNTVGEMVLSDSCRKFFQGIVDSGFPINITLFGKPRNWKDNAC